MRKKHVLLFILLPAIALLFAVFGTGCTNQPDNEQLNNEQHHEIFLYERDFPNFVEPFDRTVEFTHDELLEAFNFIADYWDANPYCDVINAIEILLLCVPQNRVRVGLDSYSEELKIAFRTHVLDSQVVSLEDIRRGLPTSLISRHLSRMIFFGTEANRLDRARLYNGQQECFTFAELRDAMTLVADFIRASWYLRQDYEIRDAIATFYLCVSSNNVIVVLIDYSEEVKEAFRANVTDSPAISFVVWAGLATRIEPGR